MVGSSRVVGFQIDYSDVIGVDNTDDTVCEERDTSHVSAGKKKLQIGLDMFNHSFISTMAQHSQERSCL